MSLLTRSIAAIAFCLVTALLGHGVAVAQPEPPPAVPAIIDADEMRTSPVAHRYIHGTIPDDAKFQLLLPANWNGKLAVFTRGFSADEFGTLAFLSPALARGYAFIASNEGWNRTTIRYTRSDTYYESRQRLVEATHFARRAVWDYYGRLPSRTIMVGASNGGHHTKWMIEDFPQLYDGGVAGYGYNSQISFAGTMAAVVRNYNVIAPRINDIVARRNANPNWDPFSEPLTTPLTANQLQALRNLYDMPAVTREGFAYNAGRLPGSESQVRSNISNLLGYLRDSVPKWDPTFNPGGGALTDADLAQWDLSQRPASVQLAMRNLDLNGRIQRPILIMHGTFDAIISPLESIGYKAMVEQQLGIDAARNVLAVYLIPRMGHGGTQYDNLIGQQIDVLERWIDWQQSGGAIGALPPDSLGGFARQ